jgi:hypothetical protein
MLAACVRLRASWDYTIICMYVPWEDIFRAVVKERLRL